MSAIAVGFVLACFPCSRAIAQACSAFNFAVFIGSATQGFVDGQKYCFVQWEYSYDCSAGQTDQCNACIIDSNNSGTSPGNYPTTDPGTQFMSNQAFASCGSQGTTVSVSTTFGPLAANTYYRTRIFVGPVDPTTGQCFGDTNLYTSPIEVRYNGVISTNPNCS